MTKNILCLWYSNQSNQAIVNATEIDLKSFNAKLPKENCDFYIRKILIGDDLCFPTPAMISLSPWFIFVPLPTNDPPTAVAAKIYWEQKKNKGFLFSTKIILCYRLQELNSSNTYFHGFEHIHLKTKTKETSVKSGWTVGQLANQTKKKLMLKVANCQYIFGGGAHLSISCRNPISCLLKDSRSPTSLFISLLARDARFWAE